MSKEADLDWLARPESFKPSIEEANKLAQEFKPFISIEDNQEQDMQQNNGWLERGELPPVGTVCEAHITSENIWVEIKVVAHIDGFALGWCRNEKCGYHGNESSDFRPIRTERERAIEDIAKIICKSGLRIDYFKDAAVAIYDAGYRKDSN